MYGFGAEGASEAPHQALHRTAGFTVQVLTAEALMKSDHPFLEDDHMVGAGVLMQWGA